MNSAKSPTAGVVACESVYRHDKPTAVPPKKWRDTRERWVYNDVAAHAIPSLHIYTGGPKGKLWHVVAPSHRGNVVVSKTTLVAMLDLANLHAFTLYELHKRWVIETIETTVATPLFVSRSNKKGFFFLCSLVRLHRGGPANMCIVLVRKHAW